MTLPPLKLNLGAGGIPVSGFQPVDRKLGSEVFPLNNADNSVDEIRASHVLEHFPHRMILSVIREWVRVLKPGGTINIAVPDMRAIATKYLAGEEGRWGEYLMGAQIDDDDYHKTVFDEERLTFLMQNAGLTNITRWRTDVDDCAKIPISLNLRGTKFGPQNALPRIAGCMSMPRVAFSDNMFCAIRAAYQLGIPFQKVTGAFWGQCLERCIEAHLDDGTEYIVTMDYDTIFEPNDVVVMADIMQRRPDIDALASIQCKRGENALLMGILQENGEAYPPGSAISTENFQPEVTRAAWAHFGLTMLRVSSLKTHKRPWFWCEPNAEGKWGEGRLDDDIWFWKNWRASGRSIYLANRVVIGHAQLMYSFPNESGIPTHIYPDVYERSGKPVESWK